MRGLVHCCFCSCLFLLMNCGPKSSDGVSTTESSAGSSAATGSTVPGPTTDKPDSSSAIPTSDGSVGFVEVTDGDPEHVPCSTFEDLCPDGQKCMPYNGGGATGYDTQGCFDVVPVPDKLGEQCMLYDGNRGLDTCERGEMCWDIGICTLFCGGTAESPICPPHSLCTVLFDVVFLCLPACDPLAPMCAENEVCSWRGEFFGCTAKSDEPKHVLEPCASSQDCAAGLACEGVSNECGTSCCHELCDVNAITTCAGAGQVCKMFYPNPALPEYEKLGICTTM